MKPEKWHRVQALFLAALARDVSERSDFLDEACSGDDTVRREVNSLLEMHETSDHLLKQDVGGMAAELLGSGDDALLSGQSFGDYQVERLIGEGGMGRVYLARDLRLGRPVALKLLPAYFTSDADRLRRFRIESRAASAINHPNIVTIYEVGREDQLHFIAAEYVEGRTLSERISEHPLPLADIVDISIQIADALDEAHRRGVIHRDIKSANIMVTDRGRVKVLDFGLAKLADSRREELDLELNGDTTAPGIVLGSVHYMSPEQALAGDVDLRTDIFSLGVVMYEMTTGRLPFRGATVAQVFVQIIHGQPQPITEYNKDRSLELERIIGKCLEKDRDQRYHSVSDLLIELRSLKAQLASGSDLTAGGKASAQGQGHGSFARTLAWRRPLVALGLIIVALFGYWLLARFHRRSELGPAPSQKFVPVIDWKQGPGELWSTEATFSPDGRMIAFSSVSNGKRGIWVKQVAGGEAVRVTSDRWFSVGPIWSPDGQSLAFVSDIDDHVAIWTASALGGSPTHLADVTADFPDSISLRHWSKDGKAIYYELQGELFALDIHSKACRQITHLGVPAQPRAFSLSPDEKRIAYVDRVGGLNEIRVSGLDGSGGTALVQDRFEKANPIWHPDGASILYNSNQSGSKQIYAAYFDGGPPRQVTSGPSDVGLSDIASGGSKLLCEGTADESEIWSVDTASGKERRITAENTVDFWPNASPKAKSIVFQSTKNAGGGEHVLDCSIVKWSEGEKITLAQNGFEPRWSPDGGTIAFLRVEESLKTSLWTVRAAGGDERRIASEGVLISGYSPLPFELTATRDFDWSPDGSNIAYCNGTQSERPGVWIASLDGSRQSKVSGSAPEERGFPLWSPDGSRVAYCSQSRSSSSDGRGALYVAYLDAVRIETLYRIESGGYGRLAGWSPDGERVFLELVRGTTSIGPIDFDLISVGVRPGEHRKPQTITRLKSAYVLSMQQSPDRKAIAWVSRPDGTDNIWLASPGGTGARMLTANSDPGMFISTVAWSADQKTIYFGKQTRRTVVSVIEKFE